MHLKEMKLGKSLEIFVDREGYRYRVVSKIEDVTIDRVCVTLIATRSKVFRFLETDTIDFIYKDDNRLWKWSKVKGSVITLDGEQVHCFYTEKKGQIYNRREAFRVFLGEESKISYFVPKITTEEEQEIKKTIDTEENYSELTCDGFIKDISESGLGIFTNQKFKMKDIIAVTILSDLGDVICKGEVIRESREEHGIYRNFYGIYFTESSKNLTRFIFMLQRLHLQNQSNLRS